MGSQAVLGSFLLSCYSVVEEKTSLIVCIKVWHINGSFGVNDLILNTTSKWVTWLPDVANPNPSPPKAVSNVHYILTHSKQYWVIPVLKGHIEQFSSRIRCLQTDVDLSRVVQHFLPCHLVTRPGYNEDSSRLLARQEQKLVIAPCSNQPLSSALYTQTAVCCVAHHIKQRVNRQSLHLHGKMVDACTCRICMRRENRDTTNVSGYRVPLHNNWLLLLSSNVRD